MTEINEKETWEFFINGARKAQSAALQLANINKKSAWLLIRSNLITIEQNAVKLYTGKAQTRLQTLALATNIEKQNASDSVH